MSAERHDDLIVLSGRDGFIANIAYSYRAQNLLSEIM